MSVPILFTTGSADSVCADGCADRFYSQVPKDKAILSVNAASHFDPTNRGSNREVQAIGLFFACWVRGEHCDDVYGTSGEEICNQVVHGTAAECHVSGKPQAGSSGSQVGSAVQMDDLTIGGLKDILSSETAASGFPICGHVVSQYSHTLKACANLPHPCL